jgi:hypothetical protein
MKKLNVAMSILLAGSIISFLNAKPGHFPGPDLRKHFEDMDLNGDGRVSHDEWIDFHEMKFREIDKNGKGSFSEKDWVRHHEEMRERHEKENKN